MYGIHLVIAGDGSCLHVMAILNLLPSVPSTITVLFFSVYSCSPFADTLHKMLLAREWVFALHIFQKEEIFIVEATIGPTSIAKWLQIGTWNG